MSSIILIPAYKADYRLAQLVEQITNTSQIPIVIVNDGSPAEFKPAYTAAAHVPGVTVLTNPVNQGKGAALKTGFLHIRSLPADITCVITADADGQHSVRDILAIAQASVVNPKAMIIGGRRFDKDVPPKSMFGNTVTRWVLRIFFGINLYDTQTGLRGVPRSLLPELIESPFDRYDLELEMLMIARRNRIQLIEIPIETIYIEKNRLSHYKPIRDSARVYFVILRRPITRLVTAAIDYLVFIFVYILLKSVPLSMLLARIVSIVVYAILLKKWVFLSPEKLHKILPRIVLLGSFFGVVTILLIQVLTARFSITPLQAKLIIELALYFIFLITQKIFSSLPNKDSSSE